MPGVVYGCFKRAAMRGEVNLEKDALRCMLATAEYKPDAADDDATKIPEAEGKGYREGGKRLTGCRVAEGGDDGAFHADDLEWPEATVAARWALATPRPATARFTALAARATGATRAPASAPPPPAPKSPPSIAAEAAPPALALEWEIRAVRASGGATAEVLPLSLPWWYNARAKALRGELAEVKRYTAEREREREELQLLGFDPDELL